MSFVVSCRGCSAPLDVPETSANGSTKAVLCPKCGHHTSVAKAALGYKAVFEVATAELWLVSFGTDDDRELSANEIAAALGERRINKATLVWREGMPEWLPLSRVSELAYLTSREPAPPPRPKTEPPSKPAGEDQADLTGGFLGTGMTLSDEERDFQVVALSSRLADSGKHRTETPLDEEPAPSSEGFLESEELEEAAASVAKPKQSAPPPGPRRNTERPEPETRSLPAAKKRSVAFTGALPEQPAPDTAEGADTPPPSSHGTPDLRSLALKTSLPPAAESAAKADRPSRPAIGSEPKSIELESVPSNPKPFELDAPPSSPKPVELGSRKSAPPQTRSTGDRPSTARKRARKDVRQVVPAHATKPKPEAKKRSSGALFVLLGAAVVVAAWLGLRRSPVPPEPVAAPSAAPAPVQVTPPPTAAPPPVTSAASAPSDDPGLAAESARPLADPGSDAVEAAASSAVDETEASRAVTDAGAPSTVTDAGTPETTFDRSAALAALAVTAAEAAACRKPGDPNGNATVIITFAPSGRVTSAVVEGPPFAGTATGGCVATTMRRTAVPPFEGAYARVTRQVWVN